MKRAGLLICCSLPLLLLATGAQKAAEKKATFTKDVAPILLKTVSNAIAPAKWLRCRWCCYQKRVRGRVPSANKSSTRHAAVVGA
ncbi:MAG: hypothetical protein U0Y68_08650 [Blastocatellia bacterium]